MTCCFPPVLRWRTPYLATAKLGTPRLDQTKNNFALNTDYLIPKALEQIQQCHRQITSQTNDQLQTLAGQLREKVRMGQDLDQLLPETYAVVQEACIRQLDMHPYEVQLLAAIALHQQQLVEMQTGEGKILAALDKEIKEKVAVVLKRPEIDLSELGLQRPDATWTYIVHDNPFGNQLALLLLDNSNIGFTADPISAIVLFFHALLQRRRKK